MVSFASFSFCPFFNGIIASKTKTTIKRRTNNEKTTTSTKNLWSEVLTFESMLIVFNVEYISFTYFTFIHSGRLSVPVRLSVTHNFTSHKPVLYQNG